MTNNPAPAWLTPRFTHICLAAILLIAAGLRVSTLHFGLPSLNDQDELTFAMGAVRMLSTPTLNPHWFGHPATTTMYGLAIVDVLTYLYGLITGLWGNPKAFADAIFDNPGLVMLPGRAMIVGFGLWTIALTYLVGKRLNDPLTGLIAAAILALSPLHVSFSQIIRSDMMAMAFLLMVLLQALKASEAAQPRRHLILSAMWTGIAMATKWPSGLILLAPAGAILLAWRKGHIRIDQMAKNWGIVVAACLCALVLASPYLILDAQTAIGNVTSEARPFHLGATGGSFAYNLWWYLTQPLQRSFGIVGLVLAGTGLALLCRNRLFRYLMLPVVIGFICILASQRLIWARWALPLLPFLAICIGTSVTWIWQRMTVTPGGKRLARMTSLALIAFTLWPLANQSLAEGRERMNDTRQQASQWVMAHVPAGKIILLEHFGFDLLNKPYTFRWPLGDAGCVDPIAVVRNKTSFQQIEQKRSGRSNVDYGTVDSSKLASCAADYAIITQYDRYAAEKQRFPKQYRQYADLIARSDELAIFRPEPGISGGWVVRVVRIRPGKADAVLP